MARSYGGGRPSDDNRGSRDRPTDRPSYRDRTGTSGGGRGDDRSPRARQDDRGGFRTGSTGDRRPDRTSGYRDAGGRGRDDRPSTGYPRNDRDDRGTYRRDDRSTADRGERSTFRRDDRGTADRGERSTYRRDDRGTADRGERSTFRRDDRGTADRGTADRGERSTFRRDDRNRDDRSRGDRAPYRRDDRPDSGGERAGDAGTRDDRRSADRPGYRVWDHDRPRGERAGGYRSGGRDRQPVGRSDVDARVPEPALPDDVTATELDAGVRRDLRGLQKDTADAVARHLVAAGSLVDDDPEQALAHARYARQRASRIAAVREAAGIAAYHAGEWNEALGELRAARRMGGGPGHLAVMADIERALGRPERAIELTRGPEAGELDRSQAIELAIVAAGARRDLGELDAAVVGLQLPELDAARRDPWSPRLFYAYADNLLAAGRPTEALEWFVHAADVDDDGGTDAAARLAELTGEPAPDDAEDVVFVEQDAPAGSGASAAEPVGDSAGESRTDAAPTEAPQVDDAGSDDANADASDAAAPVVEVPVVEVPVVEAPVEEAPDGVPSSAADPVSGATAGDDDVADPVADDVADGPR